MPRRRITTLSCAHVVQTAADHPRARTADRPGRCCRERSCKCGSNCAHCCRARRHGVRLRWERSDKCTVGLLDDASYSMSKTLYLCTTGFMKILSGYLVRTRNLAVPFLQKHTSAVPARATNPDLGSRSIVGSYSYIGELDSSTRRIFSKQLIASHLVGPYGTATGKYMPTKRLRQMAFVVTCSIMGLSRGTSPATR